LCLRAEESDEWEQLRTRDVGADWTEPRVCEQALGGVQESRVRVVYDDGGGR
jgi:hypothetical protein